MPDAAGGTPSHVLLCWLARQGVQTAGNTVAQTTPPQPAPTRAAPAVARKLRIPTCFFQPLPTDSEKCTYIAAISQPRRNSFSISINGGTFRSTRDAGDDPSDDG